MRHEPAYINGIGLISPQSTSDPSLFLQEVIEYRAHFLQAIDPDYKVFINPLQARRMSRLIKMGITSAKIALHDANIIVHPPEETTGVGLDAIITGTGLGSVEDTERILNGMVAGEQLVNPTPFIQSTYNTISSQIAITLKCHNYNSTYVHRSFSFESALQDAMLQFDEDIAGTALVGGIDEMTANHLMITRRAGHWKMEAVNNLQILSSGTPGALAGEGAAYFILGSRPTSTNYAALHRVETIYKPANAMEEIIARFLSGQGMSTGDLDAVILGYNGDNRFDQTYDRLAAGIFSDQQLLWYKHLCGEYYTSTGFALWLAANILRRRSIPAAVRLNDLEPKRLDHILIYNQYNNINHSLLLVGR